MQLLPPVTSHFLRELRSCRNPRANEFSVIVLRVDCCLGYFGFLRDREFTIPSIVSFNCSTHLALVVVSVDSCSALQALQANDFKTQKYAGHAQLQDRCCNYTAASRGLQDSTIQTLRRWCKQTLITSATFTCHQPGCLYIRAFQSK